MDDQPLPSTKSRSTSSLLAHWGDAIIDHRYQLLAIAVIVGLLAAYCGRQLALNRSIENMFAADDPILEPYRRLQRTFGENEIVMAIYSESQLTTQPGRERLERLTARLRKVPGVVAVVSLLDPPGAIDFANQEIGARFRRVFEGYTHNHARDTAGVVCLIERPGSRDQGAGDRQARDRVARDREARDRSVARPVARRETLDMLRQEVGQYPSGVLVGEPVLIEQAFDLLDRDGARLNTWCTALVLLTLLLCFRSLRWVILPLAVVQLTLALTRCVLVLSGLQLSMVSSMLAAIVTVVAVATVVHVIVRFQSARAVGLTPRAALRQTFEQLALPVAFACLTDAAGFAALMISNVGPVHDFGLMMAIGSLLVLPSSLLVSAGLVLWGYVGNDAASYDAAAVDQNEESSGMLDVMLSRMLELSYRGRVPITWGLVVVTLLAIVGARSLDRETQFTKNFRPGSPLVESYEFVEQRFGGAGVWDLMIPAPRHLDKRFLQRILQLEDQLAERAPQLGSAISLADAIDAGVGGLHRPLLGRMVLRGGLATLQARMPEFIATIWNVDPVDNQPWLRVLLRAPEQLASQQKTELIEQVTGLTKQAFPQAEATGYYVLLTKLIESVLADQWITFGVAALAVLVMMSVAFGNMWLALATMVPNTLPVLVLFGAMGWLGVKINMGAAMIAAVSVGLSVDGSIHYVMNYQRRRREGATVDEALTGVQATVGRAATFATLALVVGFATLATSDFVPTAYFGVLVSLSMIGGLLGNLVLLPGLIRVTERDEVIMN